MGARHDVDTALLMYRTYVGPLSAAEVESYYQDMKHLARLFGTPGEVLPETYGDFVAWWRAMLASETICVTPEASMISCLSQRTPLHRAALAASAEGVRRAFLPLLPDLARALPGARAAERELAA